MNLRFVIPWMLVAFWIPSHAGQDAGEGERSSASKKDWDMPPPKVWMGLRVSKPEESTAAQISGLPEGIGFVVTSVDEGGPAEGAGLQKLDVIWKMGDQMLVNEAQMVALLRLASPGDEITVSAFRAGKPFDAKITLAKSPKRKPGIPAEMLDAAMFPGECGGPMRVVNVADKSAAYECDKGRAEIRRSGEIYRIKITGPEGDVIHEADVPKHGRISGMPKDWWRIAYALRRGLDHALEKAEQNARQPRPRVVMPPEPQS